MTDKTETGLKLYEFTSITSDDGKQVVRVSGRIADHLDPKQQEEWIAFQFSIDVPTNRNGAILRQEALLKVTETLRELALDFGQIGNLYR